jgi:hypothetical protein
MGAVTMRSSFRIPLWLMSSILSVIFCTPSAAFGAEKYYYLHISSFRAEKRAVQDVERLRNKGYNAVAKREQVSNMGYWYRVYIGPFSSLKEARLKRSELRSQRLVDYVAIHKEESLIPTGLEKPPEKEERKVPIEVERAAPELAFPQEPAPPVPEKHVEFLPVPERPLEEVKEVPAPPKPPVKITAPPPEKKRELAPTGRGRNMGRGDFSLGLRHISREVEPELTRRTLITSDGITTTIEDVSLASVGKDDFPTELHMNSLRLRFGLNDYLEVFAELGGAYQELSDSSLAYGAGLRLNLFQVRGGRFGGLYGGLQGEYLGGTLEYEYNSSAGNKWRKEADWEEFVFKGELGVARPKFAYYIGVAYLDYREDTERQLLENLPPSVTSYVLQDELEEGSLGAFGGVVFNLTPAVLVNIEGQVVSQKSIFATLEYHF